MDQRKVIAAGLTLAALVALSWILSPTTQSSTVPASDDPAPRSIPSEVIEAAPSPRPISGPSHPSPAPGVGPGPPTDPQTVDDAPPSLPDRHEGEPSPRSAWPLTREGIDGSMKEVLVDVLGCYQAALDDYPDLAGGFAVFFTVEDVDGIGEVASLEIRDPQNQQVEALVDSPMENCVLDQVQTLQFDAPMEGPVSVEYPFRFQTGD